MEQNVRIARQLVRIAKMMVATNPEDNPEQKVLPEEPVNVEDSKFSSYKTQLKEALNKFGNNWTIVGQAHPIKDKAGEETIGEYFDVQPKLGSRSNGWRNVEKQINWMENELNKVKPFDEEHKIRYFFFHKLQGTNDEFNVDFDSMGNSNLLKDGQSILPLDDPKSKEFVAGYCIVPKTENYTNKFPYRLAKRLVRIAMMLLKAEDND